MPSHAGSDWRTISPEETNIEESMSCSGFKGKASNCSSVWYFIHQRPLQEYKYVPKPYLLHQ